MKGREKSSSALFFFPGVCVMRACVPARFVSSYIYIIKNVREVRIGELRTLPVILFRGLVLRPDDAAGPAHARIGAPLRRAPAAARRPSATDYSCFVVRVRILCWLFLFVCLYIGRSV